MARGIADFLSFYLEAPAPAVERRADAGRAATLFVPAAPSGVVEPFLLWNLSLALRAHGRSVERLGVGSPREGAALVLQHGSAAGARRAARGIRALDADTSIALVVYGESARAETRGWIQQLAERDPLHADRLVYCGGISTGTEFARALLRRHAVACTRGGGALGEQFRAVAAALSTRCARGFAGSRFDDVEPDEGGEGRVGEQRARGTRRGTLDGDDRRESGGTTPHAARRVVAARTPRL